MRRSLSGVQARVDRLASRLRQSAQRRCSMCRGKDRITQLICVYGDEPPPDDLPAEAHCEACGRLIPYDYSVIAYHEGMKPPDEPDR
jgi:hypothetical protein